MKQTPFLAWLMLLALLIPTPLHAEDITEKEPKLSLEASLSGDDANPVLTIRLTNIGEVPVIVDKELMLMLKIQFCHSTKEKLIMYRKFIDYIEFPEVSELESRLILLEPGEKIKRQIPLREGYEDFTVDVNFPSGDPDEEPEPLFNTYGERWRMPEDFQPTEILVFYGPYEYFVDYVAANVKNVDAAQLYYGKIDLLDTVYYNCRNAADDDEETD